jgi:hypothetical protein
MAMAVHSPPPPVIQGDVLDDSANACRWTRIWGADFDRKVFHQFSSGIRNMNVVNPMLSAV